MPDAQIVEELWRRQKVVGRRTWSSFAPDLAKQGLEEILLNPVLERPLFEGEDKFLDKFALEDEPHRLVTPFIAEMTLLDYSTLPESVRANAEKTLEASEDSETVLRNFNRSRLLSVNHFAHDKDSRRPCLFVSLDLNARDSEIIESLKLFISEARERYKIQEQLKTETIETIKRKIIEYRVFPYLDLLLWQMFEDRKLKLSVVAAALYPDGKKGEYEIRTQTKKYAEHAMAYHFMASLAMKVRQE